MITALREALGRPDARSFQLQGEDLALLSPACLAAAAARYAEGLGRVPAALRPRFEAEQAEAQREAHAWLRRHNRSVHGRIAGYLELGRRCRFAYPWPVVAVLGIVQVLEGIRKNRLYGLAGPVAWRAGVRGLAHLVETTEDVLRRTNRGIFADSVPTVLYALRCRALVERGEGELAGALLDGPAPILMDEEGRALARGLCAGLGEADPARRFRALADLTLEHFGREQRIFSHHLGDPAARRPATASQRALARLVRVREVPAPAVVRRRGGVEVVYRPYRLPDGFEMRDHEARVAAFGDAFVRSVTGAVEDYRAAAAFALRRFGRPGERADLSYP